MKSLVIAALAAALPLVSANAEIITVEYESTLGAGPPGWPPDVVMVGTFSFDSAAIPDELSATRAIYPVLEYKVTLNDSSFIGNNSRIIIFNDQLNSPLPGSPYLDQYEALTFTTGSFSDFSISRFHLYLEIITAQPGGPLTSLDLPLTEENLAAFDFT